MAFNVLALIFATAAIINTSNSQCLGRLQDPLVFQPTCGCLNAAPTLCGAPIINPCQEPACNCFKDLSNTCTVCEANQQPVCSCLQALSGEDDDECSCGSCCSDTAKSFIYFPEVEYPVTVFNRLEPYFYGSCFSY